MDIVVTIKQVPDPDIPPSHFKVDEPNRKVIPPQGVAPIMNGYDANALEEALRLREKHGGTVTVISVGDEGARDTLKRGIAMGADAAIQITDPAFANPDGWTTASVLAAAIQKIGTYDLILCGRQASDTDGGQVHLGLAQLLDLPSVSPVQKIEEVGSGSAVVHRILEGGYQRVEVQLPALLGASSEMNEPRYPALKGIMASNKAQIPVWTAADLGLDGAERKVEMRRLYVEAREGSVELIDSEDLTEAGRILADKLREAKLV
jgi:electron transfer flavoprotein beta subunit